MHEKNQTYSIRQIVTAGDKEYKQDDIKWKELMIQQGFYRSCCL